MTSTLPKVTVTQPPQVSLFLVYYAIAPEHLQGLTLGKSFPRGDHFGDLYSFGIILYQILFRIGPYEKTSYGHKGQLSPQQKLVFRSRASVRCTEFSSKTSFKVYPNRKIG